MNGKTESTADAAMAGWRDWSAGLDNGDASLHSVFDTLPTASTDGIEQVLQLLEHPASPYRGSGMARLRQHDCLRIVLGRGLLNQDEAFVLGYAMGTVCEYAGDERVQSLRAAARLLYKPPYRMTESDLVVFDLAFELAARSGYRHIGAFDFDRAMELDIGDIRNLLDIDVAALKAAFREERLLRPGNRASERLPVI